MLQFLYGFAGALACIGLFAWGAVCGWMAKGHLDRRAKPDLPTPGEVERRRLKEEQEAFRLLQNYSAERAYGMTGNERDNE